MRASPWSHVTLTALMAVLPAITAFLVSTSPSVRPQPSFGEHRWHTFTTPRTRLYVSSAVDPFAVLNLRPTVDKKEIKRAYKRMALHYHPDIVTNKETSLEDKKRANDAFAEINWAYSQLSGKNGEPSSTSSTSSTSSNWRDPRYEEEEYYDAGGDSFDKKLEDLFNGGGDMFRDFEELLQVNVDGYSNGEENDDAQVQILLKTGSIEQLGMKMYDMELLVQRLDNNRRNLADELDMLDREIASTYMYLQKRELEEMVAQLEAKHQVVDGNVKKVCNRLSALQTRYKQLAMEAHVDGLSDGEKKEDAQLQILLKTGSVEQVGSKMKDTELMVQRLDRKMRKLADELEMLDEEIASTFMYLEKRDLEEMMAQLEAKQQALGENAKNARNRLLALQKRYNQLVSSSSSQSTSSSSSRTTSSSTRGTYSSGSPVYYEDMPNTREQQQIAGISWTIRLRDDVTGDTLSNAEKERLEAATWPYEFSVDQQAHCIASRMLNEYLENPHRDMWSPPVPSARNPAEGVALKVVEFCPSSEQSTRTPRP